MEIWKTCTVAVGYEVSDLGRVRSIDRYVQHIREGYGVVRRRYKGRVLRPGRRTSGHVTVAVGGRTWDVHQLVLRAFVGDPPTPDHMCRHKDGVPHNNVLTNLTYGTRGENMQDRKHHGGPTKLTVIQIREIKTLLIDNVLSGRAIARIYGVSKTTVYNIDHGRVHVDV